MGIPTEGGPGQEIGTQVSSLIPEPSSLPLCAGISTHTQTCAHTPWLSPMLQELQQEIIASVGHDILRNPGGENVY